MFTRSHLQELKRRYASIYAPPVDIEGVNQYKKDTPGQEEEIEEPAQIYRLRRNNNNEEDDEELFLLLLLFSSCCFFSSSILPPAAIICCSRFF